VKGARILVVDDELEILRALQPLLAARGYAVTSTASGEAALAAFERQRPDLILLDLGLPDMPGLDLCRLVREESAVPIIILSVREQERDKVAALDLGADDYLTKPFGAEELLARIRVALRHAARPTSGVAPVFRSGGLEVDFDRRRVSVDGQEVRLTPTEYDLLKVLVSHPGKVLTRRMLLQAVWGSAFADQAHYLHVYVAQLRRKLEPDSDLAAPRFIVNDPGVGYRFRED